MQIQLNGEPFELPDAQSVADLLARLELGGRRVAVELNLDIVPRSQHASTALKDGDRVEIVHAIGGGQAWPPNPSIGPASLSIQESSDEPSIQYRYPFVIAGRTYGSRLLVGTGKYKDLDETRRAIEASGAEIVTVAVRRTNIGQNPDEPNLLDVIPPDRYTILPNTAGCYDAVEAVRTCRLARELLDGHNLVKLEVLADQKTLFPNVVETLKAAEQLVKDGFDVMVYTSDDPIIARQLAEIGCIAVMPLAGLIGSGLGICNPYNLRIILEEAKVPVLVDAGVGTASDAAIAMELGCEAVLMNTAIAHAKDPVMMAEAMKHAIVAGRLAYLAGRMPRKLYASASSPLDGLID